MSVEHVEPRPPSPTMRLHEVTMAALNRRPSEPVSDVSISRNAKNDYQFEVTVRSVDPDACAIEAQRIIDILRQAYPHSSERTTPGAMPEGVEVTS